MPEFSWRFQRVPVISPARVLVARVVSVGLALVVAGIVLAAMGFSPFALLVKVIGGTFGSSFGLEDFGLLLSPLILTGLAVAVAMNIGVWNIGADGQFYMGALFATAVGIFMKGDYTHMLIAMFVAGAVGGTVWILIPTLARVYAQVDEIITTLLLNFVALLLVYYVATGPWRDKAAAVISATPRIQDRVPSLMGSLHWGIVVAVILTLIVSVAIRYTKWGYEVRVSGANKHAAHYAGMPVTQRVVGVMLLSGAIAGIAGMLEVAGTVGRLQGGISNNFGYLGIVVAVLASGSPIGVLLSAFFIALVLNSGIMLQTLGISTDTVLALTGLILMFAAVGHQFAHYKIIRTDKAVAAPRDKENAETVSAKTPESAPLTGSAIEAPAE